MTNIFAPHNKASKWEMGFNSAFKGCMKNQQKHQLFIQFINYLWQLLHVSALHCHLQGAFLVHSERCSIEEQSNSVCIFVNDFWNICAPFSDILPLIASLPYTSQF